VRPATQIASLRSCTAFQGVHDTGTKDLLQDSPYKRISTPSSELSEESSPHFPHSKVEEDCSSKWMRSTNCPVDFLAGLTGFSYLHSATRPRRLLISPFCRAWLVSGTVMFGEEDSHGESHFPRGCPGQLENKVSVLWRDYLPAGTGWTIGHQIRLERFVFHFAGSSLLSKWGTHCRCNILYSSCCRRSKLVSRQASKPHGHFRG
jgi:hypothetical protein